jgi:hypothetical protein
MNRDRRIQFLTHWGDRTLSLLVGEDEKRERFRQLVIDTYDHVVTIDPDFFGPIYPAPVAVNPMDGTEHKRIRSSETLPLTPELIRRWEAWDSDYPAIQARNPQLELYEMLSLISESHAAASWPAGYEWKICDWIDGADPCAPPPFDDRYRIVTPEFFGRLRELRKICEGWLYFEQDKGVVFVRNPEWERVRAEHEAVEALLRKRAQEALARHEQIERRCKEIISLARSDTDLWTSLRDWEKSWEVEFSKLKPSLSGKPAESFSNQTATLHVGQLTPDERKRLLDLLNNPPVDPIFSNFVERVRDASDPFGSAMIVMLLRGEVRRELGLSDEKFLPELRGLLSGNSPRDA